MWKPVWNPMWSVCENMCERVDIVSHPFHIHFTMQNFTCLWNKCVKFMWKVCEKRVKRVWKLDNFHTFFHMMFHIHTPSSVNRGNRYKDYVHIFWDQIYCPLNGGVPKERMINYTICSIKPPWMRLLAYNIYCMGYWLNIIWILFLSPTYNLFKPTKFF